jgi:hypothetical protein
MDPQLVKNALASVISSNPDVALALANQKLLESMNLTPEQMMNAMNAALADPSARLAMLKNLIKMDKIQASDIPEFVEAIGEAQENLSNADIVRIYSKFKPSFLQKKSYLYKTISFLESKENSDPTTNDLKMMTESDPEPFIPESLNPIIFNIMKTLSPDELKALNNACMNDPAFTNAMMANNPQIAQEMGQLAKEAEGSQTTSEALANAGLTQEQKRNALVNSVNGNVKFADKMAELSSQLNPDEAALQETITKVKDMVDASSNDEAKSEIDVILAANMDPENTMKAIHEKESITTLCAAILKEAALKDLGNLDESQLEELFTEIAANPAMAKMMAESNPALASSIEALKDPNTIYGPDGKPVDPNSPLTKESIEKLTELEAIDDQRSKFVDKPELVHEGSEVKDMTDPENPVTFETIGQLTDK